jgi:hypothetical protein
MAVFLSDKQTFDVFKYEGFRLLRFDNFEVSEDEFAALAIFTCAFACIRVVLTRWPPEDNVRIR